MDLTFLLSAVIFTLLAIVVATSIFNGSPPSVDFARGYFGPKDVAKAGLDKSSAWQNGHITDKKKSVDDCNEVSGSSHDHWEVVKSVLSESEESESRRDTAEHTPSQSTPDDSRCVRASRSRSYDLDSPSAATSSGSGRRSLIGLSEKALLKCAFSYPQTEGLSESPDFDDMKYLPGQARSNRIETMMSKQELEEEQRVQREQLAAIFQLLRENKETFGEVSEGELEDQFRLYSI